MDATARTFRYLDEEEVAAQRKAAQGRPQKRQGGEEMKRAARHRCRGLLLAACGGERVLAT